MGLKSCPGTRRATRRRIRPVSRSTTWGILCRTCRQRSNGNRSGHSGSRIASPSLLPRPARTRDTLCSSRGPRTAIWAYARTANHSAPLRGPRCPFWAPPSTLRPSMRQTWMSLRRGRRLDRRCTTSPSWRSCSLRSMSILLLAMSSCRRGRTPSNMSSGIS
jgi:hypothetical protein